MSHQGTVRINAAGRYFEGQAIDISRTGMQIVVTVPETDNRVLSITFSLPQSEKPLRIPVRLARSEPDDTRRGRYRLGLEFEFEADEQILLIQQYVRALKHDRIQEDDQTHEERTIPRTECDIRSVSLRGTHAEAIRIADISTEGLLLHYHGELSVGQTVDITFLLGTAGRTVTAAATVVYVVGENLSGSSSAGLRFLRISEVERSRLHNFIVAASTSSAMRLTHERMAHASNALALTDPAAIAVQLRQLRDGDRTLYVLLHDQLRIVAGRAELVDGKQLFVALTDSLPSAPSPGADALCSFAGTDASYRFSSTVTASTPESLTLTAPTRLDRSEKRSYKRKTVVRQRVTLTLPSLRGDRFSVEATVADISWRGFLCEFVVPEGAQVPVRAGQAVAYTIDPNLELGDHGQIRHVTESQLSSGGTLVHVGVEAMIARNACVRVTVPAAVWEQETLEYGDPGRRIVSRPVRYTDDHGRTIVALLTATRLGTHAPVIVIPPAFGKKKEAHAPLVAMLLENAARTGRDLVTIRFDGINRPGESFNETKNPARGYEMIRYRPSQGASDIRATLAYVYDNPLFQPNGVVLFTSSMSSVDARKVLANGSGRTVHGWVSLMGVPAAQRTLSNILAGTDIISNAKDGIQSGVRGMLGHMVDLDALARDLIQEKYAYLTDARHDMAEIAIPALWICGAHDRWVDCEEVLDLMSVDSGAERQLVEIPTGHNLRSSEDAMKAFKRAAEFVFQICYGETIDPVAPAREVVLTLVTTERERLIAPMPLDENTYWDRYLLGERPDSEGYDFYGRLPEFRTFLQDQVRLAGPADGQTIADIGCGTGLLAEAILRHLSTVGGRPSVRLVAVDLVERALESTRQKCERLLETTPALRDCGVEYVRRDLQPNRLRPIAELIKDPALGVQYLRDRIDGLSGRHVDALSAEMTPELMEVLCGQRVDSVARVELKRLPTELRSVATEIHRAACLLMRDGTAAGFERLRFDHLRLGTGGAQMGLEFSDNTFDTVVAGLFLSYVRNPDYLLAELARILKPGGRAVISSMRPDSDVSVIFTDYVTSVRSGGHDADRRLRAAEEMLNEAAGLFELEEEGYFRFFTVAELERLLRGAGFTDITSYASLGTPAQAVIVTGRTPQ